MLKFFFEKLLHVSKIPAIFALRNQEEDDLDTIFPIHKEIK